VVDESDLFYLTDDEPADAGGDDRRTPWTIAVVDDDPAVHEATRFALHGYALDGRGLVILSAHSAESGRKLLREHPETALVLLDVVMETDDAGLDLVDFVRKELANDVVRIILRTGQPGQAPERRIVIDHDINDYKSKTELTADRLFTTMTAALRSYEQLRRLQETRRALEEVNACLEERVAERTAALVKANERLEMQRADLRRANRLKNEILGTIAHDLKNPLSIILGRAEMMQELLAIAPPPVESLQTQIEHVRASARHLTTMVDSLVADAMNDALDITIRREALDYAALVGDVVASNRLLAERKEQRIMVRGPAAIVVNGDQDRLREAIDNLVSNAIKYSPAGSMIEVTLSREDDAVVCRVRDEGPGLSPEDELRVFERFQRLSAKPTAGETSTGLGLSIVKRIAELHGGRVTAESLGPGRGSIFSLHLAAGDANER
jgi:signal transduction histidine kinase